MAAARQAIGDADLAELHVIARSRTEPSSRVERARIPAALPGQSVALCGGSVGRSDVSDRPRPAPWQRSTTDRGPGNNPRPRWKRAWPTRPNRTSCSSPVTRSRVFRRSPTLPDQPPAAGEHGCVARDHEYKRHGTLSLLARVDLLTGQVQPASKTGTARANSSASSRSSIQPTLPTRRSRSSSTIIRRTWLRKPTNGSPLSVTAASPSCLLQNTASGLTLSKASSPRWRAGSCAASASPQTSWDFLGFGEAPIGKVLQKVVCIAR